MGTFGLEVGEWQFFDTAGKLLNGLAPGPPKQTGDVSCAGANLRAPAKQSISQLHRATSHSAGLDLCSSSHFVLTPEMGAQAIPTGIYGPLPVGTCGLVLGRSSLSMKGLRVIPGLIDCDYEGELKVMLQSEISVFNLPAGTKIAQLLLIPYVSSIGKADSRIRGTGGFGSTDVYLLQPINHQRPELQLTIDGRNFTGLLDTGADVSMSLYLGGFRNAVFDMPKTKIGKLRKRFQRLMLIPRQPRRQQHDFDYWSSLQIFAYWLSIIWNNANSSINLKLLHGEILSLQNIEKLQLPLAQRAHDFVSVLKASFPSLSSFYKGIYCLIGATLCIIVLVVVLPCIFRLMYDMIKQTSIKTKKLQLMATQHVPATIHTE
ncbi:uncharacterized protein LOC133628641 [Colius striatus]|uniref:uncharacterized protein LOC133628641 n=1 Tax=Colius striatus TaxID=57412 RepID=UPI002B1D8508|nr:uncharacterized protein LOC133628641 [Colius striatus]